MDEHDEVDPQILHDVLLHAAVGLAARFGDHVPSDEEVRGYLVEKLIADGYTEESAKEIVQELG